MLYIAGDGANGAGGDGVSGMGGVGDDVSSRSGTFTTTNENNV